MASTCHWLKLEASELPRCLFFLILSMSYRSMSFPNHRTLGKLTVFGNNNPAPQLHRTSMQLNRGELHVPLSAHVDIHIGYRHCPGCHEQRSQRGPVVHRRS